MRRVKDLKQKEYVKDLKQSVITTRKSTLTCSPLTSMTMPDATSDMATVAAFFDFFGILRAEIRTQHKHQLHAMASMKPPNSESHEIQARNERHTRTLTCKGKQFTTTKTVECNATPTTTTCGPGPNREATKARELIIVIHPVGEG